MTFEQKLFPDLTGGLNTSVPAEKIEDNQSPYLLNMVIDGGLLTKDWGYAINDETISGRPKLIYEFHKKDRLTEILLITTTRMFTWKMNTWFYVGSAESTMSGEYGYLDAYPWTLADASDFTVGDRIAIILDDGSQFVAVVTYKSGNDLSFGTILSATRTVLDGARIIKIAELNGTEDTPVVVDTFPASDGVVITNGKDDVMIYVDDLLIPMPNLVSAVGGGNCTARTVLVKDNKVLLFNTNENGTDYPQRVRWCATGDYTDWTTASDAGYEDLYSDSYHITAAKTLGPSIVVYKEKAIVDMKYVGSADYIYFFTTMLQTVGAASPHSVVDRGDHHIVIDPEVGFYTYAGGYTIQPIGQGVFDELFSSTGNLNKIYKLGIFTTFMESRHIYVAMLPVNNATTPNIIYMLHTDYNAWTKRDFSLSMSGMREILLVTGITWADAAGAWEDSEWYIPWNDITIGSAEYRSFLWGYEGTLTRGIWEYSAAYTEDADEETTGWYVTPELVNPQGNVRVDRIKVKGSGTSITVEYSTDAGETWADYGTLTPGDEIIASSCYKQVVSTRIRFRLSGVDMTLSWVAVYWNKEDEE